MVHCPFGGGYVAAPVAQLRGAGWWSLLAFPALAVLYVLRSLLKDALAFPRS